MKLNLLPTYVSKGNQAKTATVVSVLLALLGVLGAVGMIFISKDQLQKAREDAESKMEQAARAVKVSQQADQVVNDAQMIIRNINLADAMIKHNDAYPDLYRDVKPYLPGFFRVTSMSAAPIDAATSRLTVSGTVKTYQQYADLTVALFRIPGATSVGRGGYNNVDPYIPAITDVDQNGRPIKPGQAPIPDNRYDRLAYYQGQASVPSFTGQGGFGTADKTQSRGAMPGYSLVTLTVDLPRPLQTPDPRSTLTAQGPATATTTPGTTIPNGGTAPVGGAVPGGTVVR
ncbi:MAG TPA: hypothetical protein VJ835_02240 [Fimbriimonadaceae bacterium]|nr:hypothetical protein [Fimbriimonadaceae bacterium]